MVCVCPRAAERHGVWSVRGVGGGEAAEERRRANTKEGGCCCWYVGEGATSGETRMLVIRARVYNSSAIGCWVSVGPLGCPLGVRWISLLLGSETRGLVARGDAVRHVLLSAEEQVVLHRVRRNLRRPAFENETAVGFGEGGVVLERHG